LAYYKSRSLTSAGAKLNVIHADDFCQFVKDRGQAAVSRRLTYDALWFVQNYVFPPSHAELRSVRGTYKKQDTGEAARANVKAPADNDSDTDSD
jgi:hypothetical protein